MSEVFFCNRQARQSVSAIRRQESDRERIIDRKSVDCPSLRRKRGQTSPKLQIAYHSRWAIFFLIFVGFPFYESLEIFIYLNKNNCYLMFIMRLIQIKLINLQMKVQNTYKNLSFCILLLVSLSALLIAANSQQRICYVRCARNSCSSRNPLACTGCDLGLINIQDTCVGSYRQPQDPIKFYAPSLSNQIPQSNKDAICTIIVDGQTSTMAYHEVDGTNFAISANIDAAHDYIQIKFNALVLAPRTTAGTLTWKIRTQNPDRLVLQNSLTIQSPPFANTSIRCTLEDGAQVNTSYPYFIVQKFQQSSENIRLQINLVNISAQSNNTQITIGVADISVFYGICSSRCATCDGPTQNQCLICRGLYLNNTNKSCSICPPGFYDTNMFCKACPPQFIACFLQSPVQNNQGQSAQNISPLNGGCDTRIVTLLNATNINLKQQCKITHQYFTQLNSPTFLNAPGWISSERNQNPVTQCGVYSLVGGFLLGRGGANISKSFSNLLAHQKIWLRFTLFLIDQSQINITYSLTVFINDIPFIVPVRVALANQDQNFTNECGQNEIEFATRVSLNDINHTGESVRVTIKGFASYFGIRDFTLGVENLTAVENCRVAAGNRCIQCKFGFIANQNGKCQGCPEGNFQATIRQTGLVNKTANQILQTKICKICPIQCKTCIQNTQTNMINCLSCQPPLVLQRNNCLDLSNAIYNLQAISQNLFSFQRNRDEGLLRRSLPPKKTAQNENLFILLNQNNTWELYPKIANKGRTVCADQSIIGSTEIQYRRLSMTRTFRFLPKHKGVSVHFHFYQIDDFPESNGVYFLIDGVRQNYTRRTQRTALCGNQTGDAVSKIYLSLPTHEGEILNISVHSDSMVKFGINDFILFLNNCSQCRNGINYRIETMPIYSVETPPVKGMLIKYLFDDNIRNFTSLKQVVQPKFQRKSGNAVAVSARILQQDSVTSFPLLQDELRQSIEYRQLIGLNQSFLNHDVVVDINNPQLIQKIQANRNVPLRDISAVERFPRYDDIGQGDIGYRTNARNFRNFFRGCAVFGMFVGLVSFLFGLSSSFDDFFVMTQVIFVHVFINALYNPFTIKIPLSGFQVVQFMAWLPYNARVEIEKGILPNNLYQYSPIVYEQFYQDIVFVRTAYHTVLFLFAMLIFYVILTIIAAWFNPQKTHKNYFRQFYYDQQDHMLVFLDKVVRFCFFTVMWAAILQFLHFQNKPLEFNIWNGVVCILMFVVFVIYPIGLTVFLWRKSRNVTEETYNNLYENLRIGYSRFWYVLVRYYYWLAIAAIIAPQWNSNPLGVLIPLIAIHIVHGILILLARPFGMVQPDRLNVCFYNYYPTAYWLMSAIQNFLFAVLQILLIAQYAIRDTASQLAYLSLGWGFDIIVCLVLANGLLRILFGLMKQIEGCHTGRRDLKLTKDREDANIDNVVRDIVVNQQKIPIKSSRVFTQRNLLQSALQQSRRRPSIMSGLNGVNGVNLQASKKRPSIAAMI